MIITATSFCLIVVVVAATAFVIVAVDDGVVGVVCLSSWPFPTTSKTILFSSLQVQYSHNGL